MPNIVASNIDVAELVLKGEEYEDGVITFGGADTLAKGCILARDSVSHKFVIFVAGGVANGNGVPKAVLLHEVVATGVGDRPARVLTRGTVNKRKLIIDANGDASAVTGAVVDQLRDYGITPVVETQLAAYDNTPG
jgi:hypothetical protein